MNDYYVYIMASRPFGAIYTGVTNNLIRRVFEHKSGFVPGHTKKYREKRLVYFEQHSDIHAALQREKQLKNWNRQWRINLITKDNPRWNDLYQSIL